MLQNIAIVDMLTVVMAGPLFLVGVLLDQFGLILQTICNVQGFFLSSLCAVFLNTVSLVAISRCLAVLKPSLYHKIFVNKIIIRLLLLGIWSSSALLSTPPMNYKEGWGAYRRLESTCWLAWLPDQKSAMAYNVIVTMVTLGVAITFSALATKVVFSAGSKVIPSEPSLPPPYPGHQSVTPPPDKQASNTAVLNTEVFFLCSAMFLLYILLWVPLTIMDWAFLKDWRDLDYRVTIAFIFLFFGRSLFNPILCFVISSNIRKEFVNLFVRCKCVNGYSNDQNVEL
ncbi:probable G-protein coupled receptor 101 [Exaiptasia diaphana]|uniref:G-protein coupled receptors family 1 profile domain-containing protein n=1 Tax=Exaiptasia diaphana TaxID=2652724 RepID=A0A913YIM4_EXADI|nr:probable G-protein coupled receptor 101 [Exaiptasia diaphana]